MDHKSGSYGGYWLPTHFQKMSKDEIKMKDTGVKGSSMLFMITDPKIQLWEALEAAKFSDMNHFVKILTEISSKNTKNKLDIHLDYLRSWVEQQRLTGSTLCAEFLSGKESFIKRGKTSRRTCNGFVQCICRVLERFGLDALDA